MNKIAVLAQSFGSDGTKWFAEVAKLVAATMQDQVTRLLDTVKSMYSYFQHRARCPDSDNIVMQLRLAIQTFGEEIKTLKITSSAVAHCNRMI